MLRVFLTKILDFLFPIECLNCEAYGNYLCANCAGTIPLNKEVVCLGCHKEALYGAICAGCRADFCFERILIGYQYDDGLIQKLIWQLKFNNVRGVAKSAGELLAGYFEKIKAVEVLKLETAVIVPIPLHKKRQAVRGFNQAEEIAKELAQLMSLKTVNELLMRGKATRSQLHYDKSEREMNIREAFSVDRNMEIPDTVILLDDVVTTGSTLNEAAAVLREAGVRRVVAVALAKRIS